MSTFNVLITGTKAGIGNGLLAAYVARPDTLVIAAIRDEPDSEIAKNMIKNISHIGQGSSIVAARYDAAKEDAAQQLVDFLRHNHPGIKHLDCVVANAGIATNWEPCASVTAKDLRDVFAVNTLGPIMLYQATRDLLLASEGRPKYFVISSVVGSVQLGPTIGFELPSYGVSKAGINWFMRKANGQEDRLVVAAVSPGWVQSDMGQRAADYLNQESAPTTLEEGISALLKIFDNTGKAESTGLFLHPGTAGIPW